MEFSDNQFGLGFERPLRILLSLCFQGESFSDVRGVMSHLLDRDATPASASTGLQALASSWSNTAENIASNLVN